MLAAAGRAISVGAGNRRLGQVGLEADDALGDTVFEDLEVRLGQVLHRLPSAVAHDDVDDSRRGRCVEDGLVLGFLRRGG